MSEQSRVMASAVVGALVGAVAGYLFYTERGREFRNRLEPMVDDLRHEFSRFQRTFEKDQPFIENRVDRSYPARAEERVLRNQVGMAGSEGMDHASL